MIEIRVYTGVPSKAIQPKSYWNTMKRFEKWKKDSNIIIQSRNLSYSKLNKESDYFIPKEKGIDVLIAVDLVSLAIDRKFDVAIIFSLDTDRSAQGIQTKNRIGATDQVHRVNGSFGDKIPINSISKHLIHTNAILIDG